MRITCKLRRTFTQRARVLFVTLIIFLSAAPLWAAEEKIPAADILYQARDQYYNKQDTAAAEEILATLASREDLSEVEAGERAFLEAEILRGKGDIEGAYSQYMKAKDAPISPFYRSEALWRLSETEYSKGNEQLALEFGKQSVEFLPDNEVRNLQMAYLAIFCKKDAVAIKYFDQAFAREDVRENNPMGLLDAAYAAKRIGNNTRAVEYLEKYIDYASVAIAASENPAREDVERLYDARREHADIVRKFGLNTGVYYARPEGDYSIQWIQEAYWQPYYGNGKWLQLYAQLIHTALSKTYQDGWDTAYSNFGVRYKPLSDHNLVFTLEQALRIGEYTTDDARGRISYSWDEGLELEPYVPSWPYATLFVEYVRSFTSGYSIFYGDMRFGRSFRLNGYEGRTVLTPHVMFDWNYDDRRDSWDCHAGAGAHARFWYREDKYNAPKSYCDVYLQYKFGLTDDTTDKLVLTLVNTFTF